MLLHVSGCYVAVVCVNRWNSGNCESSTEVCTCSAHVFNVFVVKREVFECLGSYKVQCDYAVH